MYEVLSHFTLRKINFVKTRTTILNSVKYLLEHKDFGDITVDEICQKAQISRGTFFNYFSTKEHIFNYFLRIFTIKITLQIQKWDNNQTFKNKLAQIYNWFQEEKDYPKFLDSYASFLLSVGEESNEMKLTDAEFVFFFPEISETEYEIYNNLTFQKIFEGLCEEAKASGEIKFESTKEELGNIVSGILVASHTTDWLNSTVNHLDIFCAILL
ncbi:TetR/AcrR family transcriptional regulator [Candidatus Epulonipiscium viviparus]|uniref:TetR/AcrR family transcriptional regulator n=1 Tax=Candidatus Epulonipiscium viviparus TaxID=420336 RepID=UPI00016C0B3A|nr:TetR/AcrR family transcriptional regulator [Candidatus Epulopiscium viviparus]